MPAGIRAIADAHPTVPGLILPFDPALVEERVEWETRRAGGETSASDWPDDARVAALFRRADLIETLLDDLAPAAEPVAPVVPGLVLRALIGCGGMGEVWRADDNALGRPVAVKLPLRRLTSGHLAARFEREGRALARLRHPNLVTVHAAGVADGRPFLVMDYVPGGSLEEILDELPVDPRRAAALVAAAADGVDHAHRCGVYHRDLKPANLLIDPTDQVRVTDFGIAAVLSDPEDLGGASRPADSTAGEVARLTRPDSLVGTPAYAAPEIHRAPAAPPRPESDVWSLGVILYRTVTGSLPFDGRPTAVRDAVLTASPPAPRAVNPRVPVWLDAVIVRCLSKNPDARYRTAGELADALRAGPVVARRRRRVREWVTLAVGLLAASAAVALAAVPEDPDGRHARVSARIATDLSKLKAVDLVPDGHLPLTYKAVVNPHLLTVTRTEAGVRFDAHGPVFVELLPGTPPDGFRLEVVLRQTHMNDLPADAGVYVCGATAAPGVRDHIALRFADVGTLATAFPGPAGQPGATDQVVFLRHTAHSPAKPVGDTAKWTDPTFGLARWRPASADPHTVRLEVQGDTATGDFDGRPFPALPLNRVRVQYPATNTPPVAVTPTGGVGLFLRQCGLLVRSARLTPLSPEKPPAPTR